MSRVHFLQLQARDPLIARDGRPMTDGQPMRSLDWLYPSVVAGSLRNLLGKETGGFNPNELRQIGVSGVFPVATGLRSQAELFVPAPADISVRKSVQGILEAFASRPERVPDGCGCTGVWFSGDSVAKIGDQFDADLLQPITLSPAATGDFKPEKLPAWWSVSQIARWLADPIGKAFLPPGSMEWPSDFLNAAELDHRIHVVIEPGTLAAKTESALFQSTGLAVERMTAAANHTLDVRLAVRVEPTSAVAATYDLHLDGLNLLHPLGGERRLVHWRNVDDAKLWNCPAVVSDALKAANVASGGVRMLLATPAIFSNGWLPDWLTFDAEKGWLGTPPGVHGSDVVLRLTGARIERWKSISGWDFETSKAKAVRRLVPAGAVYFFNVEAGNAECLEQRWLRSVCNPAQDQLDGFGLALWGVWEPHSAAGIQ